MNNPLQIIAAFRKCNTAKFQQFWNWVDSPGLARAFPNLVWRQNNICTAEWTVKSVTCSQICCWCHQILFEYNSKKTFLRKILKNFKNNSDLFIYESVSEWNGFTIYPICTILVIASYYPVFDI